MQQKTHIANVLERNNYKDRYDTQDDYHIETTVEPEGGLRKMCNLSDLIEEKGIEKGIEQGRQNTLIALVQDGLLPVEEAAKRAEMAVEDFKKLLAN